MGTDAALPARLHDLACGALYGGEPRFSRFLDPAQRAQAEEIAQQAGAQVTFFGGMRDAERVMAAFYAEEPPAQNQFPLACVKLTWNARYGSAAHRDLLGAQMALGLERSVFGDIAVGEAAAYCFAMPEAARYLLDNMRLAGRCVLKGEMAFDYLAEMPEIKGRETRVTVSSMRLDALVAAAYDLSRQDAQKLIEREWVKLNHVFTVRTDAQVGAGDLISARGYGRAKVLEAPEPTRKGRLGVKVFLYGE
ncbi:MAG: YlmH/Sll1252 family protein [Clostridia bacterium]